MPNDNLPIPDFMRSKPRRSRKSSCAQSEANTANPMMVLWALRMLVPLGGHQGFIREDDWRDDSLAVYLGVNHEVGTEVFSELSANSKWKQYALKRLRDMHAEAEASAISRKGLLPGDLQDNASSLARKLGLSDVERDILVFTVCLHSEPELETASDFLGSLTSSKTQNILAVILGYDKKEIQEALSGSSKLGGCGLVTICQNFSANLKQKLDLLSDQFGDRMMAVVHDPIDLIRDTVRPSKLPTLSSADYAHIGQNMTVLQAYLREALNKKRKGVNIFVYGPPGTGKSELARVMASLSEAPLFEIASEDNDGDPVRGEVRLRSYRAAMAFFSNHRSMILFDEVEDIFNDGGLFGRSTAQLRKAWINRMLEESPVPTIWLSNTRRGVDAAFIRRFDIAFELDIAPPSYRKGMLQKLAGQYLSPLDIDVVAASEQLAPAVITRAVSVIDAIQSGVPQEKHSETLVHLINNTLEAQGHDRVQSNTVSLPSYYDPALINVADDLIAIKDGLRESPAARLCLYGPPGTGKTAFGRWLAEALDKPLIIKRVSDLMSMYVGGTEKNIAAAFREAETEGALLLIDEVDGFLADRRKAQRSWETTQVNEMLTQMESFKGVFVASTNLMDGLDPAALRRFDIKLKFDYLRMDQAWLLLCRQCESFGIPAPENALRSRVDALNVLTPGDFAVVARQHRFRKFKGAGDIITQLIEETLLKEDGKVRKAIGFVH